MGNGLDERRRTLEEKWAHDQDLRFKVHVRRAKLLGLWAAGEMGLGEAEAEAYAKACVAIDMSEGGDAQLFAKVKADFAARAIARTDHLLRTKMVELLDAAKDQVMHEI